MTQLRRLMVVVALTGAVAFGATMSGSAASAQSPGPGVPRLTKLWSYRLIGPGTAPAIANGEVFVTAASSKSFRPEKASKGVGSVVYAFNATCATPPTPCPKHRMWVRSFPYGIGGYAIPLSPPGLGDGNVYVGTVSEAAGGEDTGFDGYTDTTGTQVVSARPGSTLTPVIAGPNLYADWSVFGGEGAAQGTGTEAVNAATGALLFTTPLLPYLDIESISAPAVAGGNLFVASATTLDAFDATGTTNCTVPPYPSLAEALGFPKVCSPLWSGLTAGTISGTPVVAGGEVYVGGSNGVLYAFPEAGCGSSTCVPDWTATIGGSITQSAAVNGTTVFVGSSNGMLDALPVGGCGSATCAPEWSATVGGSVTAPAVDGSLVYAASTNDLLDAFAAAGCGNPTCAPEWQANVHRPVDTAPAASNGVVFVTDEGHSLHAYRVP